MLQKCVLLLLCLTIANTQDNLSSCVSLGPPSYYECSISGPCSCAPPASIVTIDLVASIVTLGFSILLLIGYLFVKEMREPPGDIILVFTLTNIILAASWIYQAQYQREHLIDPNSELCKVMSYIDLIASQLSRYLTFSFFCFFFMATSRSLRTTKTFRYVILIFPFIATFTEYLRFSAFDGFGMSVIGVCYSKANSSIKWQIINFIFHVLFPIVTMLMVKKGLPQCKQLSIARYTFLRYYYIYAIGNCIINLLYILVYIFIALELENFSTSPDGFLAGSLLIATYIGNILRIIRPLTLAITRVFDPSIRKHWIKIGYACCCCRQKNKSSLRYTLLSEIEQKDLSERERTVSLSMQQTQINLRKSAFLTQIQHTVRVQVLYSLLSSIHYYWKILETNDPSTPYFLRQELTKTDFRKMGRVRKQIKVSDAILKVHLPELMQEIQMKDYKAVEGLLTIYGPGVFNQIIETEKEAKSLKNSLDLPANYPRIIKAGINEGGKSGEFFFFSYDNNLVIKTISDNELKNLLIILPAYGGYFKKNPQSLIAKIYGVFTFERIEPYEKYNLILMKNVNGLPSECIERKYDLKGSTYGRKTVKTANPSMDELKYFDTLKDLDFNRFEKKLHIPLILKDSLLNTLRSDAEFLRKHSLIDYSLVVYIVDKDSKLANSRDSSFDISLYTGSDLNDSQNYTLNSAKGLLKDDSFQMMSIAHNEIGDPNASRASIPVISSGQVLRSMKSTKEKLHYRIGIIDYLIKYTTKKKLEKFGKKLIACNPNLDISVQHPDFYANRFIRYMERVIKDKD